MSTVAAEQALNRPVSERGEALLSIPEDQWFDRKSARMTARDLSDAILGFANAEGGLIVVGLWNGEVEGVSEAPQGRLSGWQQAAIDFIQPPVRCRTRRVECVSSAGVKDHLVVVEVEPSDHVHTNKKDEVYLRVGDENRRLTFAQRQELLYDKGQASFEATAARGATFSCLDQHLLASYAAAVNHPDARRLLAARGLLDRSDHPTAGVVLLFGSEPEQWFPEAHVRVLRYAGSERGTGSRQQLLDDVRISSARFRSS
jgi:ATP-dependent DNA helicase RecG